MRTTRLDFFRDPMGSQIHQKTLYFREFIGQKNFNWTMWRGEVFAISDCLVYIDLSSLVSINLINACVLYFNLCKHFLCFKLT